MRQKIILTITDEKITVDYEPRMPTIKEFGKLNDKRKKILNICDAIARKAVYIFNTNKQVIL